MNGETIWIASLAQERLGPIWVATSARGLVSLHMHATEADVRRSMTKDDVQVNPDRVRPLLQQVHDYFAGQRRSFDFPIDWDVLTPFQAQVLQIVYAIPYGQTRSYQEIADALEKPGAARAVGRANATNPMPIVIPCHRVLGSDGGLHGYGGYGGVETKAWLLKKEGSRLL